MQILNRSNSGQPCCLYWIGGGCHQIASCHSDELGMTDQKLVFARVDRLTPIPSRQQQQSKATAQEFVLFIICRWTFGIETNSGFTLKCRGRGGVYMYVRLWYPRSFLSIWRHLYYTPHQEWGAAGGFIFLFRQLVGLLRQSWRKKLYLKKSNKATVFSCSTHSRRLRRRRWDIPKHQTRERRPQLLHRRALVIVFMAKDKTEYKTRHFSCFGFFLFLI